MLITSLELILIVLSTSMITAVATFILTCLVILKVGKRLAGMDDDTPSVPVHEQ